MSVNPWEKTPTEAAENAMAMARELMVEALQDSGMTRAELAAALAVGVRSIDMVLAAERLEVVDLAAVLHVLGYKLILKRWNLVSPLPNDDELARLGHAVQSVHDHPARHLVIRWYWNVAAWISERPVIRALQRKKRR